MLSLQRKNFKRDRGISSISFGNLTIREYAIGVGDNPSVSRGIPISLKGWHIRELKYTIDAYEALYPNRGQGLDLVLSSTDREMLLSRQGYSNREIFKNTDFVQKLRSNTRKQAQKQNKRWNRRVEKFKKLLVCRIIMTIIQTISRIWNRIVTYFEKMFLCGITMTIVRTIFSCWFTSVCCCCQQGRLTNNKNESSDQLSLDVSIHASSRISLGVPSANQSLNHELGSEEEISIRSSLDSSSQTTSRTLYRVPSLSRIMNYGLETVEESLNQSPLDSSFHQSRVSYRVPSASQISHDELETDSMSTEANPGLDQV